MTALLDREARLHIATEPDGQGEGKRPGRTRKPVESHVPKGNPAFLEGDTPEEREAIRVRQEQIDRAVRFGKEFHDRRLAQGYRFLADLARETKISLPYLSQVERGYRTTDFRPVQMSDPKIQAISKALDWPLEEIYQTLGKFVPRESLFAVSDKTLEEEFGKLPEKERLRILKRLVATIPTK